MSYHKKHIKHKFKKLKPKKPFFKKPLFWICFSLILILTLTYFFLFSWFQVSKIHISGNSNISSQDIENSVLSSVNKKLLSVGPISFSSKSILLLSKKNVSNNILNKFPNIKEINVSKKLPDSIDISVTERSQFAIFCDEYDKCFLIDDNGVIFSNASEDVSDSLVLQKSMGSAIPYLGQKILEKSIIDDIKTVNKDLEDNFKIKVNEVIVSDNLQFKTSERWSVYFDPSSDISLQISEMNALLKEKISEEERKTLEYIYLQYKDRAYYK